MSQHKEQLTTRALALLPELANTVYSAFKDDKVVRLHFVGPGPDEYKLATAPRAKFAARDQRMRKRSPSTQFGEVLGFLMVSDDQGGIWMPLRAGLGAVSVA